MYRWKPQGHGCKCKREDIKQRKKRNELIEEEGGKIETKEIENKTAVGESASGTMEEGLAVRKEANIGRIGKRTGVIEISGIRKGISEVEDGSVTSKNRGKEGDKKRKMKKNEG